MDYLKRMPWGFHVIALLLLGGAVYQGLVLYRLASLERALARPAAIVVDENTPPPWVFAKARWFGQTGQSGEAARLYGSLRNTKDADLRQRALHNLGALYLRDGAKHWNAHGVMEYAHVSTQLQLAKESLREALRLNPQDWDARYNLEYAYRITPPPKELGKADFQGTKSSVFSTLPGLPAGGP